MYLEDMNFDIIKTFNLDSGDLTLNFLINNLVEEKMMKLVFDENYGINEFIYYLIFQPSFSFNDFNIKDFEAELILRSFVKENSDFFKDFDNSNENFFEEFQFCIKKTIGERQKVIKEIIDNQTKIYAEIMDNMFPTIDKYE